MSGKPRPKPCYLDEMKYFGMRDGRKVWRSPKSDHLYTWDSLHGEIEAFNRRGQHVGSLDAVSGALIKKPVPGRKLHV